MKPLTQKPLIVPQHGAFSRGVLPLLLGHFGLFGLLIGGTGVLWAEIVGVLGLSKGLFGSTQLIGALVSVALLTVGGSLSARLGVWRLSLLGLAALCATMVALAVAGDLWAYLATLVLWGAGQACLDLAMNGATLDLERATGRPVMSVMHAGFSGGAMLGAFLAGALLGLGWHYTQVLWLLALVVALLFALTLPVRYPPAERVSADTYTGGALRMLFSQRALLVLAGVGLLAILAESAANLWAVIYLHSLGAEALVGGAAFGLFNGAMLAGRLANAPLVARFGPRASLLLSGAGMTLAALLLLPSGVAPAIIAFIVLGVAVAGVVPTVLSDAVQRVPGNSGAVTSAMMAVAYAGFIVCPPFTGWLAELLSLRAALLVVALGGLPLLWLARRLRA